MSGVTLEKAVKRFGDTEVIHGVDLEIEHGEFCVFVGPSGCGKSTLLRMIAGLEETTEGVLKIGDRDVTKVDPAERGVAMVFQTYALYPHMTVAENMGFGLKMNGVPKADINRKVDEAGAILKLDPYMDRKPAALSGGQRQRVAIGRAIVRGPEVFLFDEPLSNLDAELRVEMRVELARLHKDVGITRIGGDLVIANSDVLPQCFVDAFVADLAALVPAQPEGTIIEVDSNFLAGVCN